MIDTQMASSFLTHLIEPSFSNLMETPHFSHKFLIQFPSFPITKPTLPLGKINFSFDYTLEYIQIIMELQPFLFSL